MRSCVLGVRDLHGRPIIVCWRECMAASVGLCPHFAPKRQLNPEDGTKEGASRNISAREAVSVTDRDPRLTRCPTIQRLVLPHLLSEQSQSAKSIGSTSVKRGEGNVHSAESPTRRSSHPCTSAGAREQPPRIATPPPHRGLVQCPPNETPLSRGGLPPAASA